MKTVVLILVLLVFPLIIGFHSCKKKDPSTGFIVGTVTDAQFTEPIDGVIVSISPSDQSTTTDNGGNFKFENLTPQTYLVQYKNDKYETGTKIIVAEPNLITRADISLVPLIPIISIAETSLDFGKSQTLLWLSISNTGKGTLSWNISKDVEWLAANPANGTTTDETDIIDISVSRNGLIPGIYNAIIAIKSDYGKVTIPVSMIVLGPVPWAIFTLTPNAGSTSQYFQVDASASIDDIDPTASLFVRWRWEDGTPFTDWITIKTASHQYVTEGTKTITLEVRDSQQNVGTTSKTALVDNSLSLPYVVTNAVTNITDSTAICGGNVYTDGGTYVSSRGVCWSTNQFPTFSNSYTIDSAGLGSFSSFLTGLSTGNKYYVRAYATNSIGTSYGNQVFFTAGQNASLPVVVIDDNITINSTTSVTVEGEVVSEGTSSVSVRGVCWNTSPSPTIQNNFTVNGSGLGNFVSTLNGLTPSVVYYIRAYATNSVGTSYSNTELVITTSISTPTVETLDITDITAMGAVCAGKVTSSGGGTIASRGICWSVYEDPTINDNKVLCGSGLGTFFGTINKAIPNTPYYVRAFATNESATGYGIQKEFTTLDAFYYSFENGQLPSGWSGQWSPTDSKAYEGGYSLLSSGVDGSSISLTITLTNPGQISFYRLHGWKHSVIGGDWARTDIKFYIDGGLIETLYGDESWNWYQSLYDVNSGYHIFTWAVTTTSSWWSFTIYEGYIDYIVITK